MDMDTKLIPPLPCMCASLRRASRALTQAYEEALRPLGLRATQFTILQVLALAGQVSQRKLGEILAMDSTTLTRTLRILSRHGWIDERQGEDRRERLLRLSKAGRRKLEMTTPVWQETQDRLRRRLGQQEWRELFELTGKAARAALDDSSKSQMKTDERQ